MLWFTNIIMICTSFLLYFYCIIAHHIWNVLFCDKIKKNTSVEEHISYDGHFAVDLVWMATENYSLDNHPWRIDS